MSTSAIIMMCFGLLLTWGGAIVCLTIAVKKQNEDDTAEAEDK